ncbi:MAG TPA: LamG-like jellyroll fold domain-containing protein [Verrucomicrobiae bacterium]|jgi:hypothetical protein
MKQLKELIHNRLVGIVIAGAMAVMLPSACRAGIVGNYPVDGSTLHMWHFDETNGTLAYDAVSNQLNGLAGWTGGFTMTNLPGNPAFPTVANGGLLATEFASNAQPSYVAYANGQPYVSYNYCILTTNDSAYFQAGFSEAPAGADPGFGTNPAGISTLAFTNIANYCNTNTGAFTMEALVNLDINPQKLAGQQDILCADSGNGNRGFIFGIYPISGGGANLNFFPIGSTIGTISYGNIAYLPTNGPDAAIQGQWYHAAVTYTGNNPTNGDTPNILTVYWTLMDPARTNCDLLWQTNVSLNNSKFTTHVGLLNGETPFLDIGASARENITTPNLGWAGFNGNIDEVRISDVCLHPDQMVFNYTAIAEPPTVDGLATSETLANSATLQLIPVELGSLPVTNQWYYIANGVTNLLAGQTNSTLTIPGVTAANGGSYYLAATNAYGGTNSAAVQVTVGLQSFDGLYNTGCDNNGNPLWPYAPGSYDPHYFLTNDPDPNGNPPYAVIWSTPGTANGGIIGPENGAGTVLGNYIYTTSFVIDQGVVSNATLSGTLISYATELGSTIQVVINDVTNTFQNGVYPGAYNTVPFGPFTGTNCGFQMGSNTLTFIFTNAVSNPNGIELYNLTGTSTALTNAPYITNQPNSVMVNYGQTASFSLVAIGAPSLNYEWLTNGLYNNSGGVVVAPFATTNRTFTFVATNIPASAVHNGIYTNNYYAIVSNGAGSVTSAVVELTVNMQTTFVSQLPLPYTNLFTLYAGANPAFSVQVGGAPAPFAYQWYTNGVWDAAVTTNKLLMTNVQIGFFTNYCVVTNLYSSPATSQVWTAQVIADPTSNGPGGPSSYASNTLALNPIGYWRMDDVNEDGSDNGNGDFFYVCHDYAGGNDGFYTNCSLGNAGYNPTTDPSDSSAEFGESDDLGSDFGDSLATSIAGINFGAPFGTNKAFTVEAWVSGLVQTSAGAGIVTLGWGNGGEQFDLDCGAPGGAYRFLFRDASGISHGVNSTNVPALIGQGPWYHLAGVVDEVHSNVSFYIDGQLAGKTAISPGAGVLSSSYLMGIGARQSGLGTSYNDQFLGYVNDVAIFNYALSPSQIANQYFQSGVAPVITEQPVAGTNVEQGSTLSVSAVANGTGTLSYQWYETNLTSQTGFALSGQISSTLVINNVQTNDSYFLDVSNSFGATNSSPVSVTVLFGLNVSLGPPGVSLYAGLPFKYSVGALGTVPFYYQWLTNGVAVPNATNSTYSLIAGLGSISVICTVTNAYNGYSSTNAGPVTLTGVALPASLYSATVLSNNPAGFWPLNEPNSSPGTGNDGAIVYDYVGGNNGIYTNALLGNPGYNTNADPLDTSALFGSYATPNSDANSIPGPDFSTPNGSNAEFTVEAWAESTTNNGLNTPTVVAKGVYFEEEYAIDAGAANGSYRFTVRNAAGTAYNANSTFSISNSNQWYHLVGVCNESNSLVSLYINGKLAASTAIPAASGITNSSAIPMTIGARSSTQPYAPGNSLDQQFPGYICDVAVYNYALSSNQVTAEYQAAQIPPPINPNPTNIVFSVMNNQLKLSWPVDHLGWILQVQTNSLSVGLGTNWVNVNGSSSVTNIVIPINLTNGTEFYRLKY